LTFLLQLQEAAEHKKIEELKKKSELATATAATIKATVLSDAAAAAAAATTASAAIPKLSPKVVDAPATTVETLMKESIGTLHKATVTSNGDLKEDLIDQAPILIDKAEVMQVISSIDFIIRKLDLQ
jgi:hypothetical protein